MIKGLRTVSYPVSDLEEGKKWYSQVLERKPYFDEAFYVGYEVGGFELGLIPGGESGHQGAVAYWGVDNTEEALKRLQKLGAQLKDPVTDVGGGIKVATVVDPFGNVFGIIENPLFKLDNVR
ncbi:VOC family protein [Desulfonatronum sp. SC1]|uniref:VOC family protein n=1 Tax=Desulfonatronum sp. SC1 TaxID=2109626 RepID=UPI000D303C4B|nr:VOC family protein [Desulfonatronum sp. SC1]PTN32448.1 glyoxalase/bleomycin resistance/extradiol dioxygenase family protein [Desulfonatronum sp. SC1]